MTAPTLLLETSFAYLASTPLLYRGGGRLQAARRRRHLVFGHLELEQPPPRVDGDRVALVDQRDQAASHCRFGGDVADHHAVGAAREAAVGDRDPTESPRPAPMMAEVGDSISRMPGPPFGPS